MKPRTFQELVLFVCHQVDEHNEKIRYVNINDMLSNTHTFIEVIESSNLVQQIIEELTKMNVVVLGKHTRINTNIIGLTSSFAGGDLEFFIEKRVKGIKTRKEQINKP